MMIVVSHPRDFVTVCSEQNLTAGKNARIGGGDELGL